MKCSHPNCDGDPVHSIRAKTAPGQWLMLAVSCREHVDAVAAEVGADKPLQLIPYREADWS
jgi:hypothetical protein